MILSAQEIAERYAGRIVQCKVTQRSDAKSPVLDANGNKVDNYEARIVGWKKGDSFHSSYVCIEVQPPNKTSTSIQKFNQGYIYTNDRSANGYGKKILPEEINLPADPGKINAAPYKSKNIPEWPHKCRDCGSPAQILGMNIDCSNAVCKNKYRTRSGLDLFLPKEMQAKLNAPKVAANGRPELDKDGVLVCMTCAGYLQPTSTKDLWASPGILNMECLRAIALGTPHEFKIKLVRGDKMRDRTGRITTYDGKKFR